MGLKEQYEVIGDVRGIGLMLAIELVDKDKNPNTELTNKIIAKALDLGLLLLSCGCYKNVVRFIAPTTVEKRY